MSKVQYGGGSVAFFPSTTSGSGDSLAIIVCCVLQDVDMNYIAKVTHGFSGADLTEICQRVSTHRSEQVGGCQVSCTFSVRYYVVDFQTFWETRRKAKQYCCTSITYM